MYWSLTFFSFVLLLSQSAFSFSVVFDPQSFTGKYQVYGQSSLLSGVQTIDLAEGTYSLFIAGNAHVTITVDASGDVTTPNTAALDTGPLSVKFNTNSFTITPGNSYPGFYQVYRVDSSWRSGNTTYNLVPNVLYSITIGLGDSATFTLDANGDVASSNNDDAFSYSGSNLSFNSTDVYINPNSYEGQWFIGRTTPGRYIGLKKFPLIKNWDYLFFIGAYGIFTISMGSGISPISVSNTDAVDFDTNELFFKNGLINIGPQVGSPDWFIFWVSSSISTALDVVMVPGLNYYLTNSSGNTVFSVDTNFDDVTDSIVSPVGAYDYTQKSDVIESIHLSNADKNLFSQPHETVLLTISNKNLSPSLSDFVIKKNGNSVAIHSSDLTATELKLDSFLDEGRNDISIEVKDESGRAYNLVGHFWAGLGQLTVKTSSQATVELTLKTTEAGEDYSITVSQETIGNTAVFKNVPQIEAEITTTTLSGRQWHSVKIGKNTMIEI